MKKLLLIITIAFLFTSCSTMLLDKTHVINIQSNITKAKVKVNDSIYSLPANVEVERSKQYLDLALISDSTEIPFKAKPKHNPTYKYANLAGLSAGWAVFGFYLIDMTNNKRFYYGKSLWLNSKDSTVTVLKEDDRRYKYVDSLSYYKHYIYKKGDFRFNVSLPYINGLRFNTSSGATHHKTTMFGYGFGADYFHKKKQFLNASYYGTISHDPITVFVEILSSAFGGYTEHIDTNYLSITNNHVLKRFSLGYGLSYGSIHYYLENAFRSTRLSEKRYDVFGLSLPVYYQAGRNLHLGIMYNPSFFRTNQRNQWVYESLISFNVAWKIKL